MYNLYNLCAINVELTSRCTLKSCWMCGRRERERELGDQDYGDMDLNLVCEIARQVPPGILIMFHNNGEPLEYRGFGPAVRMFGDCVTHITTNGKLLLKKASDVIDNLDTLAVSIFEGDDEQDDQYEILKEFLRIKGTRKPHVIARLIGDVDDVPYKEALGLQVARRALHKPKGSVGYTKQPVVPEAGFCWDIFTRLSIDRHGNVSPCVRFDPKKQLVLGNIKEKSLAELWNCTKRKDMLKFHIEGRRAELDFCGKKCEYYGVPTSD